MRFRTAALAALLVVSPAPATAQTAAASAATDSIPAPSLQVDAAALGSAQAPLSAPAVEAMRGARSPWLIPTVGALVGAGALSGVFVYGCAQNSDGCMLPVALPAAVGGVVGAGAGLLVEWTVQGSEQMRAEDRRRQP